MNEQLMLQKRGESNFYWFLKVFKYKNEFRLVFAKTCSNVVNSSVKKKCIRIDVKISDQVRDNVINVHLELAQALFIFYANEFLLLICVKIIWNFFPYSSFWKTWRSSMETRVFFTLFNSNIEKVENEEK